jgi:O-antigen ligase
LTVAGDWRFPAELDRQAVRDQQLIERHRSWFVYGAALAFTLVLGAMGWRSAPAWSPVAFAVLVVSCVAAFIRPRAGVYLIIGLTMMGDGVIWPWWPFTKNFSSRESVLFLSDRVFLNPLELVICVTAGSFLLRKLADPLWQFSKGVMLKPILVFTGFVVLGFARGQLAGGDRRVAIFEARALLYIVVVYVLITNLFRTRQQYQRALLIALTATAIQSVFAIDYYGNLLPAQRLVLEELGEHTSAVFMATVVVFLAALGLLKGSRGARWAFLLMTPVVVYAFFLSQRRAAMVALFVGVGVVAYVTFFRRRRAFWFFVPATLLFGSAFVIATWGAKGALGLPASAVQTIISPDSAGEKDQSSNLYRQLEALNIHGTIRGNALLGVGFGKPFNIYYPMPDISWFEFWQFRPHNSVLWLWLKMGFFGFVASLFMFARAVQHGVRSALDVVPRKQAVYVATGLAYVFMLLVFSYVDISWDARSTVLLALSFALCADFRYAIDEVQVRSEGPLARAHFPELVR